jgi:hypothetical protein
MMQSVFFIQFYQLLMKNTRTHFGQLLPAMQQYKYDTSLLFPGHFRLVHLRRLAVFSTGTVVQIYNLIYVYSKTIYLHLCKKQFIAISLPSTVSAIVHIFVSPTYRNIFNFPICLSICHSRNPY